MTRAASAERGDGEIPSSPLKAIRAKAAKARVAYNNGADLAAAVLATASDVAIVFVNEPTSEKIQLAPGQSKTVTLKLDPKFLSIFNEQKDDWELLSGEYRFFVGGSSRNTPLTATATR